VTTAPAGPVPAAPVPAEPALAGQLSDLAWNVFEQDHGLGPVDGALRQLESLAATMPDPDLLAWSARLAVDGGDLPLLGAGAAAAPFPALLWNAERCRRADLGLGAPLTLVGLVAGAANGRDATTLARAVAAAAAVADAVRPLGDHGGTAGATTDVIAAAVCAALLSGVPRARLAELLDTAGSLMAITAPGTSDLVVAGRWAGHAAAAGWLAVRVWTAGVVGIAGGLAHTLAVVTGDKVGPRSPAATVGHSDLLAATPGDVPVRSLLEALR
jgi:hypothetical protein